MLKQSHTKTSPPSVRANAPELFNVAKGLKYGRYHDDDVIQFSAVGLPKGSHYFHAVSCPLSHDPSAG